MGAFDDLIQKKPKAQDDVRRDGRRIPTPAQFDEVTQGSSALSNFAAGVGGGMRAPYLGTQQIAGAANPDDVIEYFRTMDSLRKTKAGVAGEVVGQVAPQLVAAMFPWTNSLLGGAAAGGVTGFVQPVRPEEQGDGKYPRINNAAQGAAWGAAFPAVRALYGAGKALTRPFLRSGQERIAGDLLNRSASNAEDAVRAARSATEIVPGSKPTLGQATLDPGLASLEQTMYGIDPTKSRAALIARAGEQTDARLGAITSWAKDGRALAAAEKARDEAAEALYQRAFSTPIDPAKLADPKVADTVSKLLKKPTVQRALADAKRLALDEGLDMDNPAGSVQGLHYVKKAIDDLIESADGDNSKRVMVGVQKELLSLLDDLSPDYAAARKAFADASKPIDQMKVGQRLVSKSTNALMQGSGNERLYANKFGQLVSDEDSLVRQATRFGTGRGLDDVLTSGQMQSIQDVLADLQRAQRAKDIGVPLGSPTAQYLTGKNILRSIAGPVGLPESFADRALTDTIASRPMSFLLKSPEERVLGLVGDALTDPQRAAQLMEKARQLPPGPVRELLEREALGLLRAGTAATGPAMLQPSKE